MKKFKLPATNQVNQSQSIKSTNQATILDTWGYFKKQSSEINEKKDCKKYNIETHQAQIQCEKITQGSNFFPHENENEGVDGEEIFNLFTDDNDLVKAVENTESVEQEVYLDTRFKQGSCCEVIPGFDEDIGSTYIYPINYPIRDYQFNIVRKALLENTLVVLPTGLGKTFLASVVMYNFYRWYPKGKLIFMAPTKPLVAQQIEACYKITGIPQVDTVEMTGIMAPVKRELLWKTKRVFFLTPQVFQNDLGRGSCFAPDVVCLVFDEAHRALGNHAYCQVVKEVMRYRSNFRVLALSATPGSDMKAVQQVISNLLISHVEVRTEESIDICKYVHHRNIEKIVVPMSMQLNKTKVLLLQVLQVAVKRLHSKKVIWHEEPEKLSRFQLIKAREQWRKNSAISDRQIAGVIEGDFGLCISLYYAYELLLQHGLLSFYNFLKGVLSGVKGTPLCRKELSQNIAFMDMMEELHSEIEPEDGESLNESIMLGKNISAKQRLLKSIPKPLSSFNSHPKLLKLEEIVLEHFRRICPNSSKSVQTPLNTRVMIFSQYRDSVQEITALLSKHEPLIKVMSFIGQGNKETAGGKNTKGLSQKEQFEVLQKFRNGGYNTIVSTSVGEEGLDIGDVDLIVCFDASNSPIRLVQRMGRTGRVRDGRIVILIGEGKEEATYKKCLSNKKGIHKNLLTAAKALNLYEENHRMIPRHLNPKCCKMNVHIEQFKEKNNNKKSVSKKTSASVSCKKGLNFKYLNTNEAKYLTEKFYGDAASCSKCKNLQSVYCHHLSYKKLSTSSWLPWLSTPQTVSNILHSKSTNALCSIMQFANECRDSDFLLNYNAKNLKLLNNSNDVVKDIANISVNNNLHKKVNFSTNAQMVEVFSIDDSDFEMSDIKPILLSNKKKKKSLSDSVNRNGNPSNTDVKVINNEDSFKPCPMEELLKSSEKVLSKKKKINLLKLPKVQVNKIDFDIKDNQVGFCSQETMPTLYDRCKQKRNGTSLLKNENIVTKSVSVNETNLCSKTLNTVNNKFQDFTNLSSSILSTIPLSPTWIDHLKSFETTNSSERMVVKDLIPDAPNDMNFDNFDSEKTSDRIVEKDLIPDAPNDMNFDSFDSEKTSGKMVVNDLVPDAPNDINFDSFDSGKTTNRMVVKDLIPDAPNHMNFDCFYSEKTSGRMVAKDLIPDAPNDMNFDSFDSEKMDFNDKVIVNNLVPCAPNDLNYDNTESKKLNDQENIPPTLMKKLNDQENIPPTLMKKLNDQENIPPTLMNYTNVKKKTEKRSLVITDSLIDYIDDFEEDICFSPPVVSNIKIKAKENISSDSLLNNNPVNKNNEKKSLQFSSINNEKIFNEDIDESIIFKKTHRKKKLLEISNCYDEQKNNGKQKIFAHSQNKEDDPLNLMSNKKVKQPVRKKSKLNNMKSKEKRYKNEYIAYEAEDDEGRIMDRESFIDDYIQDSFIDDATQFSPDNINKQNKDHIDMDTIYKRSLLSPSHAVANSLRFTTPAFKAGANRFRLADLKELKDSDQSSEAEEVLGLVESDEYHSNNELQDELAEQTSSFHLPILKRKKRCFSFLDSDDEFNSDADTEKSIYNDNTEVKPPVRVQPINESLIAKQILNKIDSQVCNSNIRFINECDLPTITFSFGIDWHGSNIDQEFNKDVQKIANKPQDKDLTLENVSPYILVSSRCIANSQIPSLLRSREKCCVVVKSQLHADFIVSRRMSVNKKSLSELSCSGNISQLYESVQCELFEKQYLIVEKDVAKINNKNKIPGYTKTCANLLSKFIGCNIKVLFSSSQAKLEVQNGYAICVPQTRDKMLKSLMCIPKMTYPLSTEVANQFRCIADLSKCSLESLKKILCNLPGELIKDIYFFFKKQFDIGMLGSKKLL
ncbi:Fanconi anemia group M protein isoform X3 [Hydra vulgaris]|uniref:Fanconi anemia group M protein isoform X3 n=1 Tax=Hydra vulgaris TaxID=6087 RepID=A0ABM4CG51_HYDVU